ncbi:MAG: tRNA pseudouridine(13) synthase TruD [Polyangiaceae bacterium]
MEPIPGVIRASARDFRVEEIPLYAAKGEGPHLYVTFEKTGLTTDEAVKRLAAHARVQPRDVGVPGMKDRHAVTVQTVSVPAPMSADAADFDAHVRAFESSGVRILSAARHANKLRTGHLRGNRFRIVVRRVETRHFASIEKAFARIAAEGVPNTYGTQRFGIRGDNVERALAWLGGGPGPRDFKQKRFLYSSLQSHIFNAVLEARVAQGTWNAPLLGDVLLREDRVLGTEGSSDDQADRANRPGLRYCEDETADAGIVRRGDYCPSGPMFGPEMKAPRGEVEALESAVCASLLGADFDWTKTRQYGEGTRRHLRLWVEEARVRFSGTDAQERENEGASPTGPSLTSEVLGSVEVEFVLPRGAYATTVLSNVFQLTEGVSDAGGRNAASSQASPDVREIQETR